MASLNSGGGGSGSGRSIFPKGPSFTLENFSNKDFIVRDFIEDLSDSAVPVNRRSGPGQQAFDPKPLIRTFETQLATLSEELGEKETDLLTSVRRAEIQHDQTLDTLGRKLDQSIDSFETLDVALNQPNNTNGNDRNGRSEGGGLIAVQIGERLDALDKQRRRAQDANFLIQCWLEVSEAGQLTSLEDMIRRQGTGENKVRCAIIARQLMRMSQRLDPSSWAQTNGSKKVNGVTNGITGYKGHNTRELIEKFSETLEKDLLKQFDESYRRQNFDDMLECSKVLHDFNGGSSVVALFVNQHQFFIDRSQLITEEVTTDNETWERLADPDSEPPGVEPSLQSLIDEIRVVMQDESFIIKRAFPYYEVVLTKFIQRIFQQSIQQRLEMVLEKADTISSLAFLRSLHASRSYINNLIEDLKAHGLTEHPEACSAQTALSLDQQLDELFVPYLVGNSYIDRERKSLEELYSSLLFKFTIYHSRRKKAPTGFMASLAQQGTQLLATAKDAYIDRLDSSELTPTQKAMMLRVAGLRDQDNTAKNEIEVTDEDGILSIPNAKRMLKWLAEGVRRALELGSGSDTPKDVSALLNLLLTSMGQVYIETALDAAQDQALSQETVKAEPDMAYLPSLQPAITITNVMSRFIDTVLIKLATSNTTDSDLDGSRAGSGYLETLQTATCLSICTFLNRVALLASQAIDGQNIEVFSSELAISIRDLLFEHFKKFQVNATGGLMVTKDMSKYVSTLKDWPLPKDAEEGVEVLSEIGNLFIIGPEALRERSRNFQTGGPGKKLQKADFRAFILRRDDSGSVGIQKLANMAPDAKSSKVFSLEGKGLKLDTAADVEAHIKSLREMEDVEEVRLLGNTLGVEACKVLGEVLETKKTLQIANFADIFTGRLLNEIPQALSSLLTALLTLPKLHTINLNDNAFGLNTQAPLVAFLSSHVPLQHLILNNNGLGPHAGILIADSLTTLHGKKEEARKAGKEVPDLETVICGRNRLENGSMTAWAKVYSLHTGVKEVKMVQNGIRQEGISHLLTEGLRHAKGIKTLDLQDNTFTILGAKALAKVAPGWTDILELGIGDSLLSAKGGVIFAGALAKGGNKKLEILRLQYNDITTKGLQAISKAVKDALPALRKIELNGNKFSEEDQAIMELKEILEARKDKLAGDLVLEDDWGLDSLSDLESEDEDESEEEEEEEEAEELREKLLEEAEEAQDEPVAQREDKDVDELADELKKKAEI
ncbi:hypothetical protein G7Y89_g1555 [Cudoniella acicularis]|uniref:Exocyst complex component Sec10 n=1 Tax=Cudoniella acicularis TaxID=354080 RepID=A0A8H4RVV0_9HELO|nr:hypothetical protein G7Y89_g1555 [Cudoniella acicularis]